jgi:hypothetical protein
MYIPPDGSFLRIATYGRGIWEIPIGKQATTTIVNSNAAPSVFGQSVTFSATVTANSGTPTGTVTFYDGGNNIGTGMLSGGIATLTPPPPLTVGTHNITASYGGDTKFSSSTSAVFPQEVDPAATSIALMSSANPSINGSSVTFTATVTVTPPGAGTPNGLVTFADNGSTIGTGMLSSGTATFATSNLIVGLHPITASYGGNADFASSVSSTLSQTVDPTSGPNADLGVMVTHSSTHAAAIGGTWTETITVTNSQASPADSPSTAVTVNVTGEYAAAALNIVSAPNGASCNSTNLTCSLGTLSIGSSATVTLTLTPLLGRSISIQASVSGGLPDNSPANNNKTDVIQVRHRPLTVKP